jgi:hypothetical protein
VANLATLSKVKNYTQPDAEGDDGVLSELVGYASALIRSYTGRLLTTPPVTEERPLYWTGRRSGRLDDKLINVTAISAPYPYERALAASEYEVVQFPTLSELRLDRAVEGKLLLTGTWGWAQVPGDIEYACVVTVDEWYRGNLLPPTGSRDEGAAEGANIYLPQEVQQILEPWRPGVLIA